MRWKRVLLKLKSKSGLCLYFASKKKQVLTGELKAFHQVLHPFVMRTFPIDTLAIRTFIKLVEV